MLRRRAASLAVAALLTSATPPPPPRVTAIAPVPDVSPLRCRQDDPVGDGHVPPPPRGSKNVAPAAPPAPPPPTLPTEATAATGDMIVTAQRVAPSSRAKGFHIANSPSPVVAIGRRGVAPYGARENTERYEGRAVAGIQDTAAAPVSTFAVDVDTGAYANVRCFLTKGAPVPAEAVRTEEMINYLRYDYPRPTDEAAPFSITTDVTRTPWNADTRLLRIGLRAYDVPSATRPPANLVFLVDTSGSMNEPDKLPLVKRALEGLADQLRPDDRVSIVAYAGSAGLVLAPTADKGYVRAAIACLDAGGSTAGGAGLALAYATARASFVRGGINRIFLATDGDFNVGVSSTQALEAMVKRERDDGITLTTLGFGEGNTNDAMMERIADCRERQLRIHRLRVRSAQGAGRRALRDAGHRRQGREGPA